MNHLYKFLVLALAPVYLFIVYYKSVVGADLESLIALSVFIFLLYVPMQIYFTENGVDDTIENLLADEWIMSYLRLIFLLIILVGISAFILESLRPPEIVHNIFALVIYGVWWMVSNRLLDMAANGSATSVFKMYGWFAFILGLVLVSMMSELPSEFGLGYILTLLGILLSVGVTTLFLIPRVGLQVLYKLFLSAVRSPKRKSTTYSVDSIEKSLQGYIQILFLSYIVLVPTIIGVSNFISSLNAYTVAFLLSASLIIVSAFGSYLQVSLFISAFEKQTSKIALKSFSFVAIFYTAMMVNMNIVNTVETNAQKIAQTQKSVAKFSDSFEKKFLK